MKLLYIALICFSANTLIAQSAFNINEAKSIVNSDEYEIRWQEKINAFQTPNRNQNLRSTFNGNTVSIAPRVNDGNDYTLTFEPFGAYRNQDLLFSFDKHGTTSVNKNRIAIDNNNVTVEYVNDEHGLRQNFIVKEKQGTTGELVIRIKIITELQPQFNNNAIDFYKKGTGISDNPILTYTDLKCWDANGDPIAARMMLGQSKSGYYVDLLVDDTDATYPILIDPLTSTPIWVLQGTSTYQIQYTASGDFNGDGLTDLLAGAPTFTNGQSSEGIVKLYFGLPSGVFDTAAAWSYESNITSLSIGSRIANAGDVNNDGYDDILIGANLYDNGQTNEGICYLFHGSATVPTPAPNWVVESNVSSAEFGFAVAGAGDINGDGYDDVVISALRHTTSGRIYVYLGSATGLALTGTIITGIGTGNEFGYSVTGGTDLNGDGYDDIVVTGRFKVITGGPVNSGTVYIYNGGAAGIATTASWTYSAKQAEAHLGNAVCLADLNADGRADIIVSAIDYDTIGTNYGLVHVFLNSLSGFGAVPSQLFLGTQTDEGLGMSIANLGDINNDGFTDIAIGSPNYDNTSTFIGRIYIFSGGTSGMVLDPMMVFSYDEFNAYSGRSITSVGDINDDGFSDFVSVNAVYNEPDIGSILLYYGSDAMNIQIGLWNKKNTTAAFGFEVESMDFDHNGWPDILIGAPWYDGGSTDEGKMFVYLNHEGVIDNIFDWAVESQQPASMFASAITDAGDINGDGFPDVAVGAYNFDTYEEDDGAVFIYFGEADLIPNEWAKQHISGGIGFGISLFGKNIKSIGDANNDGYDDLLITAENYQGVENDIDGATFLYYGSADGLHTIPDWQYSKIGDYSATGTAAITLIDLNGDAVNDIVISSPSADGLEFENEGHIDIFYGTPTGFSTTPSWTLVGEGFVNNIGISLSSRGDVNGDGYDDFLYGERIDDTIYDTLIASLVLGSPTFPIITDWFVKRKSIFDQYANELEISADVNGDGYDDIFVSRALGENGQDNEGVLELYYGSLYLPKLTPVLFEPNIASAQFGTAVLGLPDINNDGVDEFVVGAPYQTTNYGQGVVYLYHGTPTNCPSPNAIITSLTESSAELSITGTEDVYYIKWRAEGELNWHLDSTNISSYSIIGLVACSNYQVKVQAGCEDGFSFWTDEISFTTDCAPCTYPPTGLYADNITPSAAKLHWAIDPDATKYKLSYRATGGGAWVNLNATSNFKNLSGLSPATTYQYKVKSVCAGGLQSPFSPTATFTTLPMRDATPLGNTVAIYPNPSTDVFHIETNQQINSVVVVSITGEEILHLTGTSIESFSIGSAPAGMYFVILNNCNFINIVKQ